MEKLTIGGKFKTPKIVFDHTTGILLMEGNSIPENAVDFYDPLITWVEKYSESPQPKTEVNFILEYYNSSSLRYLWKLFSKLETIKNNGTEVIINWHYDADDPDSYENGMLLKEKMGDSVKLIETDMDDDDDEGFVIPE